MTQAIVFVANGFNKDNARLQPWRYIYELARHRCVNNEVIIVTDGESDSLREDWDHGLQVIYTRFLNIKKQKQLRELILSCNPVELWWSTTTRTLGFYPLLARIPCRRIAFITSPLYRWRELIRASMTGVPLEQTRALWLQRIMPRFLFARMLNGSLFDCVFVQSAKNRNILLRLGVSKRKVHVLPVGLDDEDFTEVDQDIVDRIKNRLDAEGRLVYLYLGALRPIRGFNALAEVFPRIVRRDAPVHLLVLARGADEALCETWNEKFGQEGIKDHVTIVGGWLSREDVWAYIAAADIVVLPFLLVPSDIPIAVLEALARNKPVVVSTVDGLPELAQDRGIIVDPLNRKTFEEALYSLSCDQQRRDEFAEYARKSMASYPRWRDIGSMMEKSLAG